MGHVKLKLRTPTLEGEDLVSELSFRDEVCAGDYRGIKMSSLADPEMDSLMKVASRLCGRTEAFLAKLGNRDAWEVATLVRGFMNAGLEDGSTP